MVLVGPKRRFLQLNKLKQDDSCVVGPPEIILSNSEIWNGKPWIVDFLTPTYEENFYRFNNDHRVNESSLLLEKIALLMGGFFIFAHKGQLESKKINCMVCMIDKEIKANYSIFFLTSYTIIPCANSVKCNVKCKLRRKVKIKK